MTEIKSGAICLFFFLCLGSALIFLPPHFWLLVLRSLFFPTFPLFSCFIYSSCIVYGSGTGAGDLVHFWISVAICNIHLVVTKKLS